jgi:hypothetical protein
MSSLFCLGVCVCRSVGMQKVKRRATTHENRITLPARKVQVEKVVAEIMRVCEWAWKVIHTSFCRWPAGRPASIRLGNLVKQVDKQMIFNISSG